MRKKSTIKRTASIAATALLLAWPWQVSVAETALTLETAIHLVRENNPALKAAAEEMSAAEARVTRSRSAYFPQITASAGYTWLDPRSPCYPWR